VKGDPLEQLRDWHLPDPISWWPPAPGWWALSILILAGLVWLAHRVRRRHRQGAAARSALDELSALRAAFSADRDARAFAVGISGLLRRLALQRFPREQVAGLSGEAWLDFLDATGGGDAFRRGPGRALAEIAYGARSPDEVQLDPDALTDRAASWIRAHERSA
jgi:hypothetical protein